MFQTVIPTNPIVTSRPERISTVNSNAISRVYDKDLVRTDSRNQKIDKFLSSSTIGPPSLSSTILESSASTTRSQNESIQSTIAHEESRAVSNYPVQPSRQLPLEPPKSTSSSVRSLIEKSSSTVPQGKFILFLLLYSLFNFKFLRI